MKISLRALIGTYAHVQDSMLRGQIAGEDARRQQDAQDYAQYSQLVQQQQSQEDRARQDQLTRINVLGHALDNPGIDDATAQQIGGQYTDAINGMGQPAPVGQFQSLLQKSPYAQRLINKFGPIGGQNGTPSPSGAPGSAPANVSGGMAPAVPVQNLPRGNSQPAAPGAAPVAAPTQSNGQLDPHSQYVSPAAAAAAPGMDLPAGTQPDANAPQSGTQPGTPNTQPGTPNGGFQSPRSRAADAEVGQSLQRLEQEANQNGDAATAAAALDLRTRLVKREITGTDAQAKMAQLQREGNNTRAYGTNFAQQTVNLGQQIARGQITDPKALQEANSIYGQMQALGVPASPESRRQAQLLQSKLGKLYDSGAIGASASDRTLDDQRKLGIVNTILSRYDTEMNALRTAKGATPEWLLARVQALSRYASDARVKEYVPEGLNLPTDIDPTPQMHTVTTWDGKQQQVMETAEEAKARALQAASSYVEDPKASQQVKSQALQQLFSLVRSPQWKAMQDPKNPALATQRQSIIASINTLLEETGSDARLPKDIITSLTPQERALNDDRTAKRADQTKRTTAYVNNLNSLQSYRDDLLELKRNADQRAQYKLDHPNDGKTGSSKEDDRHFQYLRQRLNHLLGEWDKQTTNYGPYSPEMVGDDPTAQAEAKKALDPLRTQIDAIKTEMAPLMGTPGGSTTEPRFRVKLGGRYLEDAPGKGVSASELKKALTATTNPQTRRPYTDAEADAKIASLSKRAAPK